MKIYILILLITIFFIKIIYIDNFIETFINNNLYKKGINNCNLILYINLKNRIDRKKNIENEIKKVHFNNKIIRIDAIRKDKGSLGCALSHLKALELAYKMNSKFTLILEDDFMWKYDNYNVNNILTKIFNKQWDVCLLSCYGKRIKLNNYCSKALDCQTASGYIIKHSYIPILIKLWKSTISDNQVKPAIDRSWKILQKKDNWISTNPILGKQKPSYSDIEKKFVHYNV